MNKLQSQEEMQYNVNKKEKANGERPLCPDFVGTSPLAGETIAGRCVAEVLLG
jgi:hypothetical protein